MDRLQRFFSVVDRPQRSLLLWIGFRNFSIVNRPRRSLLLWIGFRKFSIVNRPQRSLLLWIGHREVCCCGWASEKFSVVDRPQRSFLLWIGYSNCRCLLRLQLDCLLLLMAPLLNSEPHYGGTGCCSSCTELLKIHNRCKAKERAYHPCLAEF